MTWPQQDDGQLLATYEALTDRRGWHVLTGKSTVIKHRMG